MTRKFEELCRDDVVRLSTALLNKSALEDVFNTLGIKEIFEVEDFLLRACGSRQRLNYIASRYLVDGMVCHVLSARYLGWRAGTINLNFLFILDELESGIDSLSPDDVIKLKISSENKEVIDDIITTLDTSNIFEVGTFLQKLCGTGNGFAEEATKFLLSEIPCGLLSPRYLGWHSGKVKLSLQFMPDEPEVKSLPPAEPEVLSPLDEIRKQVES